MLRDCAGADSVSSDEDRSEDGDVLLPAGLLADLRAAGRDLGALVRGREVPDFGLAAPFDLAAVLAVTELRREPASEDTAEPEARDVADRDLDRLDEVRGLAVDRAVPIAAGLAADRPLAAVVSAFAAVLMALVAVFIAFMADDIVLAELSALVAAAVILVAAEVTLVAAVDTVRAAVDGVAEPERAEPLRLEPLERDPVERDPVERDAAERDAVERDAVVRLLALAAPEDDRAAVLLADRGVAIDCLVDDTDFGRLAVPRDALRLTDLLAVPAELRLAAPVVD